jgi:hypothetical protein
MTIDAQLQALRGSVPDVVIERARRLVRLLRLTWTAVETNENCFGALFLRAEDVGSIRLDANDCYGEDVYDSCGPVYRQLLECERLAALEDLGEASLEAARIRDEGPGAFGGYELFRAELEQAFARQSEALDRLRATEDRGR